MPFRFYAFLLFLALAFPALGQAQDSGDGSLHVLRPSIDAEQDAAEICLEVDHPLDLSDRARIASGIHLTMDGKAVSNLAANLNATGSFLCLEALEHRRHYDLTIATLRGAKGEKLPGPYTLSFTVPDRHPTLAFAGDPNATGLLRYRDGDPTLRAINIARAQITLYRLTDPAAIADAYRQRLQTSLAPSESLTFARNNGQPVWQGELVLDNGDDESTANRTIEQTVPLRAALGPLAPGLYFLAAAASEPARKAKNKTAETELVPLAAQWFLRSGLRLHVIPDSDGFYVETENAEGTASIGNVHLTVTDRDRQTLAEGQSDADGTAFLPVAAEKRGDAATLAATAPTGDVDFADLTLAPDSRFAPPDLEPTLVADRPFYRPGAVVSLALDVRNIHDEAVAPVGGVINLLRPDHSFYETLPVPETQAGISYLSFPAPAVEGAWSMVWQQGDGRTLATAPLRVTSNKNAPHVEITADRPAPGEDGAVDLTLKSLTGDGKPAPYIAGHIELRWSSPDTLAGWPDYKFGVADSGSGASQTMAAFITDGSGLAAAHIILKPPEESVSLRTALIEVQSDPAAGVADPDPLALPLKPGRFVVGLKPLAAFGKFAENGLARFDVMALDGDGKRQSADDLSYEVYEEGRSFAWYQADGRWEFKPLQQRRRIGGGALALKAGGTIVSWPVTAGSYTLEITGADGTVLARAPAEAGWGLSRPEATAASELALEPEAPTARPGAPVKIGFTLDKPAMISAVVADDRVRKVIHQARPAGDNTIEFTPEDSWGNRIGIELRTKNAAGVAAGHLTLPVQHDLKALAVTVAAAAPDHATAGQEFLLPVAVANIAAAQPTFVSIVATPLPEGPDNGDPLPESIVIKGVKAERDGNALIRLTAPVFTGALRLRITAANQDQKGQKELSVPVRPVFAAAMSFPSTLRADDFVPIGFNLKNNDAPDGVYHYAISASPGLKLSGALKDTVTLAAGQSKTFPLSLRAVSAGSGEIRLELTGPRNFHDARAWPVAVVASEQALFYDESAQPIAPQQSWALPPPGTEHTKPGAEFLFIGAQPLFDAPELLQSLLEAEPFTTSEIAAWLEATRLWRDVIVEAGLRPTAALDTRRGQILFRLLRRQRPDGAFPALPGGDADTNSTAAAASALARADRPVTRPAFEQTANWLQQKVRNSWFEEKERPERAAAFAALAAVDRLDIATLRYFAETSADKTLPPLAMAQLAAALVKSGDQDKAAFWLKAARAASTLPASPAVAVDTAPDLLAALANDPLLDPQELVPAMQKLAENLIHHASRDPASLADLLAALWALEDRAGDWRAAIDDREKTTHGVMVMALPEKYAPLSIRNPLDRPLFVLRGDVVKTAGTGKNSGIGRHIYRPDGGEIIDGRLERGGIYVVDLEGPWPAASTAPVTQLFIHDVPGGGLRTVACALDADAGSAASWAWLKNLSLTPVPSCEPTRRGTDTVIASSGAGNGLWHIAYLVEAEQSGSFNPSLTTVRTLPDSTWLAERIGTEPIEVK